MTDLGSFQEPFGEVPLEPHAVDTFGHYVNHYDGCPLGSGLDGDVCDCPELGSGQQPDGGVS